MAFDVIFSGGHVVDGTGEAARRADVGVCGDRITAIDDLAAAEAPERIDCAGLVVAPGFIDIHTHYDPWILADPDLTPSSWYGVTTAIMGNCGFSMAPLRPGARGSFIETMGNVEAMPIEALEAGIEWKFESFGEYLQAIESHKPELNVAVLVGHTPLRLSALGENSQRAATADEIRGMQIQLENAMSEGAWGFSTSKAPAHVDAHGRPITTRAATFEEIEALSSVLASANAGVMQGVNGPGLGIPEFIRLAKTTSRPVTWGALHQGVDGGRHWELSRATTQARAQGAQLWAQMGCLPLIAGFTLASPYILESVPAFGKIARRPHSERLAALDDRSWRAETERQIAVNAERRSYDIRWDRMSVSESAAHPELIGRTLAEIAGPGRSPLEAAVELSKEDGFKTRFKLILFNWDEDEVARLLREESSILGLGDAGAHMSQMCDASFALHLLGRFVRERRDLSLEFAVWRLSGHPAKVYGIEQRGLLRPGFYADLCVFDPNTVGEMPPRRLYDLPAGADRLVKDPLGIEHVMVNGRFIRRAGVSRPRTASGRVLRP